MNKVALIGSGGQLASDIAKAWQGGALSKHELVCLTHADLDVTDADNVNETIARISPSIVINTAAFVRTDDCEREPQRAMAVNAQGARNLAEACRDAGALLVQISTDYVFSGEETAPYTEDHVLCPINAYGISKQGGETYVESILPNHHLIVRSSGLYGEVGSSGKGGNFVETMLRVAKEGKPLRVVNDQTTTPTYTRDLALTLLELLGRDARGTYHVTNAGECTWYEFAQEIFAQTGLMPDLTPITTAEYPLPARRPRYSVLSNAKLESTGIAQPRPWKDALADYLARKGHKAA